MKPPDRILEEVRTLTKVKTLVAGTLLAFAAVPFTAPPAHACLSVSCIVNCVHNVAGGELVCRL